MNDGRRSPDFAGLTVPLAGTVEETGDPFEPYQMLDAVGERVVPVAEFLADLQACGRSEATQRSYSLAMLRWFRFLWAVDVPWDQATRTEARDYIRWVQVAGKPGRRRSGGPPSYPGAEPGDWEVSTRAAVRDGDGRRRRDRGTDVLRLPPAGRDRAAGQSLPAGQSRPGPCSPQPDGAVRRPAVRAVP